MVILNQAHRVAWLIGQNVFTLHHYTAPPLHCTTTTLYHCIVSYEKHLEVVGQLRWKFIARSVLLHHFTSLLHYTAPPLHYDCTTTLHHYTAPLHCTTTLHHYTAPLHCTSTMNHHCTTTAQLHCTTTALRCTATPLLH